MCPLCCGRVKGVRVSSNSRLDLELHDFSQTLHAKFVYYFRICFGLYYSWFLWVLVDGQWSDAFKHIVTTSFHIQWNFLEHAVALRCEGFSTFGEIALSPPSGWFSRTKLTTNYPTQRCVYFHSVSRMMECDPSVYLCLPTYRSWPFPQNSTLCNFFSGNSVGKLRIIRASEGLHDMIPAACNSWVESAIETKYLSVCNLHEI